jgi:ankyrin repeat protein
VNIHVSFLSPLVISNQYYLQKGKTVLHIAASYSKFPREVVSLMILKGADVSHKAAKGRTPLNTAVRRSRKLVPLFLAHGADPFVRTISGKSALDWARENGRLLLLYRLEETRNVIALCIPYSVKRSGQNRCIHLKLLPLDLIRLVREMLF